MSATLILPLGKIKLVHLTAEELPVSDYSGFTIGLKSGLQASSLSSPLKIGQSPEAAWNVRLSKLVASCLSQLYRIVACEVN